MKRLILEIEGFKLYEEYGAFYIELPDGGTLINLFGSKEGLITELIRWKTEIDYNNPFMLNIEDKFINILENI